MTAYTLHPETYRLLLPAGVERSIAPASVFHARQRWPEGLRKSCVLWLLEWTQNFQQYFGNLRTAWEETRSGAHTFTWSDPPGESPFEAQFVKGSLAWRARNTQSASVTVKVRRFLRPTTAIVTP